MSLTSNTKKGPLNTCYSYYQLKIKAVNDVLEVTWQMHEDDSGTQLIDLHVFALYWQYVLYGPLVAKALYSWVYEDGERYSWCFHILIICALRGLVHQLWSTYSNMLFLTRNRLVIKQGVDFKQIDKEWDW